MTTEEKFYAAVNVIKSLPKDGAYQPSADLKLRFYAYFKQATEGPCNVSKPGFWDVVGRVKWEAWHKLGNMSKNDAMVNYVEELKKIVETMSYNANVETFLGSLGNFYDTVPIEDLEMLLGPVIERVRSQPGSPLKNSPLVSRDTSPLRIPNNLKSNGSNGSAASFETSPVSSMTPSPQPPDTEDEDEEYIDTVETTPHASRKNYRSRSSSPTVSKRNLNLADGSSNLNGHCPKENGHVSGNHIGSSNGVQNGIVHQMNGNGLYNENVGHGLAKSKIRDKESPNLMKRRVAKQNGGPKTGAYVTDVSEPIREAILHLQKDLDRITSRVRSLEANVLSQSQNLQSVELCENCCENVDEEIMNYEENVRMLTSNGVEESKRWWPFSDLSRKTTFFVILWPIAAHFILLYLQQKRNRQLNFCSNLLELRVPEVVEAVLECIYGLDGDEFYSIKWYKEELEFFRYMPRNSPQKQTFPVDGINVAVQNQETNVVRRFIRVR